MKIHVVGGCGRVHALVWKLLQSMQVTALYCAPGNAGIAGEKLLNGDAVVCFPVGPADVEKQLVLAKEQKPDLVICSEEDPLGLGIVDRFQAGGFRIWGQNQRAAKFECSKAWSQWFCEQYGVPCAMGESFRSEADVLAFARRLRWQCVLKADGLALGKGAFVCHTEQEVRDAISVIRKLGPAGELIVVQELLQGRETSLHFFCDGRTAQLMPSSVDHKSIGEAGVGPNTGGMGTVSPDPHLTSEEYLDIAKAIMTPWLIGCKKEGIDFRGVLYPGVMLTAQGPKVLEFNARFGDSEAQTHLVRLETDLVEIIQASIDGNLCNLDITWKPGSSVCVVLASKGYPGDSSKEKGRMISGLNTLTQYPNLKPFHAGTTLREGNVVVNGGRVLGLTTWAETLEEARLTAYRAANEIRFGNERPIFRCDIGGPILNLR
ncbi:MAG: phosphoribosylamine--glycine ligase [Candidatus Taylorbacteria bacterium]|nr:phosphoribosylamine--glycine ligase [Candidatus Taylorbacteria bacterium]